MKSKIAIVIVLMSAAVAEAQLGGLLKKIDSKRVKKGAEVVRQASHEFTEDEEADIGRVVAARVLATYPLAKDEKPQRYVTLVGNTVAAYSSRPTLEWHFAVIDTPIVNAFSCPGGFIFITSGALTQIKSEAELAAVLGHEIAHTTQRHILKEVKRNNTVGAGLDLARTTPAGSFLTDDLAERIGRVAYDALFTKGLSRRDEEEADKLGVEMAASAGYKAAEYLTFLDALVKIEGGSEMKVLGSTHPSPEDRIAYLKPQLARENGGAVLAERWAQWTAK